jgi:CO dehydrogenase maturation factor
MSYLIAVSGKGGVGKTTVAGLLTKRLAAKGCKPVLAVDADPNTCLDSVLGVSVSSTIGRVREEARDMAKQGMSAGMSKQDMLEMRIEESLVESDDFDLIAMGRSEGPGCYCYANNVLKSTLQKLARSYPYVVLDNEAGLENMSRRIVQEVDLFVMVTNPSRQGMQTVRRLHELAGEMDIRYSNLAIVVNGLRRDSLPEEAGRLKEETGAVSVVGLPDDDLVHQLAERGGSLDELPEDNPVVAGIDGMVEGM